MTQVRAGQLLGLFPVPLVANGCFFYPDSLLELLQFQGTWKPFFSERPGGTQKKRQKMFILGVPQTSRDPAKGGLQGICKAADLTLPGSRKMKTLQHFKNIF